MAETNRIFLGASRNAQNEVGAGEFLDLRLANRHGLVTGATGTGKTVTLQILAEGFSDAGVPVFCADVSKDGQVAKCPSPRLRSKWCCGWRWRVSMYKCASYAFTRKSELPKMSSPVKVMAMRTKKHLIGPRNT